MGTQSSEVMKFDIEALREKAMAQYREVLSGREEILKAFIAKHGCEPDEVMQVEQQMDDGTTRYWVEKKQKP